MSCSRLAMIGLLLASVGCVQLTPAGARVQVLDASQESLVANCKYLASVSVSSQDALKNAAAAQGSDVAMMSVRDVGTAQVIKGELYDCTGAAGSPSADVKPREPTPAEKADAEYKRKSGLCQSKGGVWINNQCVVQVE